MAISCIKAVIKCDIRKVWEIVTNVEAYAWRSDLLRTERIDDKSFAEYTKKGYPTIFKTTVFEPFERWEFDMENSNMSGHWTGIFIEKGNYTEVEFTEKVTAKKLFLKPFVKLYLKNQQAGFVNDLKRISEKKEALS